jgi:hypothetical protein
MSYCRFSDDDLQCDLYCFGSGEGYVTHVRQNRVVGEIPLLPDLKTTPWTEWHAAFLRQMDYGLNCEFAPIELSHVGESFQDSTLEAFKKRLLYLRGLGYRFPDRVLDRIDDEIRERDRPK